MSLPLGKDDVCWHFLWGHQSHQVSSRGDWRVAGVPGSLRSHHQGEDHVQLCNISVQTMYVFVWWYHCAVCVSTVFMYVHTYVHAYVCRSVIACTYQYTYVHTVYIHTCTYVHTFVHNTHMLQCLSSYLVL